MEARTAKSSGYLKNHPTKIPIILSTIEEDKKDFFNGYKYCIHHFLLTLLRFLIPKDYKRIDFVQKLMAKANK